MGYNKTKRVSVVYLMLSFLLMNVWCGFFNHILLQFFGGVLVTFLDMAICFYLFVVCQTKTKDKLIISRKKDFVLSWVIFSVLYIFIYLLGWGELPVSSFAGLFVLPKQVYTMLFTAIYILAFSVVPQKIGEKEKKSLFSLLIIIFFAIGIANIIAVIRDPSLSKAESYTENASIFTLGYSLSYVLALMMPIFLHLSTTRKNKWVYITLIIVSFVSLYYSAYFLALIAAILSAILFFVFKMKNKALSKFVFVLVVGVFVLIVSTGMLQDIMLFLADNISIDFISERCREIAEFAAGGMDEAVVGKTTYRFFIYKDTLTNFFKHPIFGNFIFGNYDCFYDHATVLDILSCGGLLLFIPFIIMLKKGYQYVCAFVDENAKKSVSVLFLTYLFIACFNPIMSQMHFGILFMIAPILLGGTIKNENIDSSSL